MIARGRLADAVGATRVVWTVGAMNVGDIIPALDTEIGGGPPGSPNTAICAGGPLDAAIGKDGPLGLVNATAAAISSSPRASNNCKLFSESSLDMMT